MRIWYQSFTVLDDVGPYFQTLRSHLLAQASHGTDIDFHGMSPGTYPTAYPGTHISYAYLAGLHKNQFIDNAIKAQEDGYDAVMIATIPDTGFEEIRTLLDIPVVAFGNASVAYAASLGPVVGIVNFIDALQDQLRRNMSHYGFASLVGPIVSIEREFGDILRGYEDPSILIQAFEVAARRAIALGAKVIVPGEGPLNVLLATQGISRVDDVPVIDSLGVLLALCEDRVRRFQCNSLRPTRRGFYFAQPPREAVKYVHSQYLHEN
jgi:allantoin racemase